ncbi:hypothetical protein AMS68_004082 [Peltaster fructicola]|uniref:Origin recognition complex subunit 2 n=1 Tax=Peltaster fructicola TaxID=286661 RepID=A0A6H0XV81_9PEZI|nr:hypothetical protein AMS68_004082 [Peltaster fructicola]
MVKRTLAEPDIENPRTPKKAKHSATKAKAPVELPAQAPAATPSHLRSILKATPSKGRSAQTQDKTPSSGRVLFSAQHAAATEASPSTHAKAVRNDISARKKSAAIIEQQAIAAHELSEAEDDIAELARAILDDEAELDAQVNDELTADQPVKRGRGRPKGSVRVRTPSPPPDLPAQEHYFFRNRPHAGKTSSNMLPSHLLLNHEDYLAQIKAYQDTHADDLKRLQELHTRSFEQWQFELEEGFSICMYGYGSKRELMMQFAHYLHDAGPKTTRIVVVNGYNHSLGIKDILTILAGLVLPKNAKPPLQHNALFETVVKALDKHASRIHLFIHNLDSPSLRKPAIQSMLARLAKHKSISLIASCDNLNFGLLWDLNLLRQFGFVFHDTTTFEPWSVELDSVEEVNLLLGRSSRRLTGKDGVGYVLRSLPENARNLFKILVTEQLTLDVEYDPNAGVQHEDDDDLLGASDEEAAMQVDTPSRRGRGRPPKKKQTPAKAKQTPVEGVEYRVLYHKAVEEFVCSSEVNFRTLLKEFHDHQMIESRKDPMGTERLIVPFRREELETILEEL